MGLFEQANIGNCVILSGTDSFVNINTLFGGVVVLAVLLLIALVYLASIKSSLKNPSVNTSNNSSVSTGTAQSDSGNVNLVGNEELVAVITAAIHASMEGDVPANGFVVRSIRRVR